MIPRTIVTVLLFCTTALAQTPTTGRIAGTAKDPNGAVIAGAEVTVSSKAKGVERKVTTGGEGNYAVPLLPPGAYRVTVKGRGFAITVYDPVQVVITETTQINSNLELAGPDTVSVRIDSLLQ